MIQADRATAATCKRVLLERLAYHTVAHVDGHMLRSVRVPDVLLSEFADSLILRLTAEIAGKNERIVDETFPSTWWEALKDRWVPAWARRWIRIRYRSIRVDQQTLFPSIEIPRHEAKIRLEVSDRSVLRGGVEAE